MNTKLFSQLLKAILFPFILGTLIISMSIQQAHAFLLDDHFSSNPKNFTFNEPPNNENEPTEPEPTFTLTPTPTSTPTIVPTFTPTPTSTSTIVPIFTPTPTKLAYLRPIIIVDEYSLAENIVKPGERIKLTLKLTNIGQTTARNILIIFETGDLAPLETGGVKAITQLAPGETANISQPLMASSGLSGLDTITLNFNVSYVDNDSTNFTESFSLNFDVEKPIYYAPIPTATPEKDTHPQLMIATYRLDKSPLEAGTIFNLELDVINIGLKTAKDVTLILGGGSAAYSDIGLSPSGITGATADFSSFAPYNSANLRFVGDIPAKDTLKLICPMIVNTSTNPGVHTFKVSFAYVDEDNTVDYLDDQIITILVHRIPRVNISFYRDPGFLQVGTAGLLPIQVLNVDNDNVLVSGLEVMTPHGSINPSSVLIGTIEAGGYFTQDFNIIPDSPGELDIILMVYYIDDFNQEQRIEKALMVSVEAMPDPRIEETSTQNTDTNPSNQPTPQKPNFLAVLWRLLLGFLGLSSAG